MTHTSKLTQKYQATVPEEIRKFLKLNTGDRIAFEIENKVVTLRKASNIDMEMAKSLGDTLSEWNSPFDEEAYNDL